MWSVPGVAGKSLMSRIVTAGLPGAPGEITPKRSHASGTSAQFGPAGELPCFGALPVPLPLPLEPLEWPPPDPGCVVSPDSVTPPPLVEPETLDGLLAISITVQPGPVGAPSAGCASDNSAAATPSIKRAGRNRPLAMVCSFQLRVAPGRVPKTSDLPRLEPNLQEP